MTFPQFAPPAGAMPGVPSAPAQAPAAAPAPLGTHPFGAPAQNYQSPTTIGVHMPPQPQVDLGAMLAGATMGITRYPSLPLGNHELEICATLQPARTRALIAELRVISSDTAQQGVMHSFYQGLQGKNDDENAAKFGGALSFLVRATGYETLEQMKAAIAGAQPQGTPPEVIQLAIQNYINSFFQKPGPVVGRRIRVSVTDSGKRTKAKIGPTGQVVGGGEVLQNYAWSPVNA